MQNDYWMIILTYFCMLFVWFFQSNWLKTSHFALHFVTYFVAAIFLKVLNW